MSDYFNVEEFREIITEILDISGAAAGSKHFMGYFDELGESQQQAARTLFIAMVDPNIRFGLTFTKLSYMSSISDQSEIKPEFIENLVNLGRPVKKDNAAIKEAWNDMSSLVDQVTLDWLAEALDKKIKMSIGKKVIAGMFPGYIKLFDVMLAHKFRERGLKFPVSVEPKIDGIRCITVMSHNSERSEFKVEFFTRTGKSIESLEKNGDLKLQLERLCFPMMEHLGHKELILDSEVTAGDFNGTSSIIRKASKEAKDAKLTIFDILPENFLTSTKDTWHVAGTYVERRALLVKMFANADTFKTKSLILNDSYIANSIDEIFQLYNNFRQADLEGAIIKDRSGHYERKRSYGWMKIKANDTADLRIIGAFEGEGKYEGMLGGLIVDFKDVEVRVGGGFSDFQRKEFWEFFQLDELESRADDMRLVGALAEVSYHEVTPDGSLRHPVFKAIRFDKDEVSF